MHRFTTVLATAVLLATSGVGTAHSATYGDVIGAYHATASEICPDQSGAFQKVYPNLWSALGSGEGADDPSNAFWPLNEAERVSGAYSILIAAQIGDFITVLSQISDPSLTQATLEGAAFTAAVGKARAGLEFVRCLAPSDTQIAQIRSEKTRVSTQNAIEQITCKQWFTAQDRILALPLQADGINQATQVILQQTVGTCEGKS